MSSTTDQIIASQHRVPLNKDELRRAFLKLCLMSKDKTVQQILDMVEWKDTMLEDLIHDRVDKDQQR